MKKGERMNVPLLNLKLQYAPIKDEIRAAIDEVLESQQFIFGPQLESLEREIAQRVHVDHAIGVSSGTDALLLSLMALGIGNGDLVITSPFTFFSTASSISRVGGTPVFVDVDPLTFTLSPEKVKAALSSMTGEQKGSVKALIPVHLYGQCADMDPLLSLAKDYNLAIIEDAAQALDTQYAHRDAPGTFTAAGAMGECGCFSFFPTKNLGGYGEGGMVVTQNPDVAAAVRKLRHHGCKSEHEQYHYDKIGINGRLDALQASVLRVKLKYLDRWTKQRRLNADNYNKLFKEAELSAARNDQCNEEKPISLPFVRDNNVHVFHQYVVRAHKRDQLKDFLTKNGIGCGIYYPIPLHLQPCFQELGYTKGSLPEAEKAAGEVLALPIFPEVTFEQQEAVVATIARFYQTSTPS
jgi:dTDP-4-amino-4,6-dideoxygalactose transaminase